MPPLLVSFLATPQGRSIAMACAKAGVNLAKNAAQAYMDRDKAPAAPPNEMVDRLRADRLDLTDRTGAHEAASKHMADSFSRILKVASDADRPVSERIRSVAKEAAATMQEVAIPDGNGTRTLAEVVTDRSADVNESLSRAGRTVAVVADAIRILRSNGMSNDASKAAEAPEAPSAPTPYMGPR